MSAYNQLPRWVFRLMSFIPRTLFRLGMGRLLPGKLLLLETIGRKTGKRHQTPVQYERVGTKLYLGSARGELADWYKNATANSTIRYNLGDGFRTATARAITEPGEILDYLRLRLERHPAMMSRILALEGIPADPTSPKLAEYAQKLALLVLLAEEQAQVSSGSEVGTTAA